MKLVIFECKLYCNNMSAVFIFLFLPVADFSEDWVTELLIKHRDKFWTRWEEINKLKWKLHNRSERSPTVTIREKQQTTR